MSAIPSIAESIEADELAVLGGENARLKLLTKSFGQKTLERMLGLVRH